MERDTGNLTRCSCGRLYRVYSMMVGDQSRCPECKQTLLAEELAQEERDRERGKHWKVTA